jgi:MFS family permease
VPQPSDDPNDPLVRRISPSSKDLLVDWTQNWPLAKRDIILAILSLVSVIAATTSPLLAANTLTIAFLFDRDFTDSALLTGYHLCGVGVAGFLFVASARVWGKRHLFLLGTVLMIISSAWGGASGTNYKSLLWARIIQGVALAPFEALVNACVGDLYFVHERGIRMAFTNVALFGGAFLTPVLVGKITHEIGWQWTFYFIAIFMGLMLPLVFVFVPETAFKRANRLNTDMEQDSTGRKSLESQSSPSCTPPPSTGGIVTDKNTATESSEPTQNHSQRTSYIKTLLPFNGRKTDEPFFKLLFRPLPLFFHIGILWACLIQGVIIGWTVLIGVVIAAIFLGPPLFFDEVRTGYLYTGAFIGSMVGLVLSGLLSDWINKIMIRWNNGKYEPEFRIVLVFPMMIFSSIGLYGFGITAGNIAKYGWLIPDVFFGFVIVGMVMGAVASALYIVDAHRQIAVEAFTCLLIFKNMFSFILTYYAYDWITGSLGSVRGTFIIIGSIQVGICLLSVPMYIFGKRNRSFFYRHDLLRLTRLK